MKLLITTRADKKVKDWADLVHPVFKQYAHKVGADFRILDETLNCADALTGIGDGLWHFRIMKHYDLHEEYDRILHFDSDILVTPNCPNLFQEVPYDKIGTVYEDIGSRKPQRIQCMIACQNKFGFIGWDSGYINTGVFLTSKCHKDIYQSINGKYFTEWGTDDVHLGYLIKKNRYHVHQLHYKFNHMTMFSEPWNKNADRFDSHVIHYAGAGIFDKGVAQNKLHQAKLDYKRLYG